MSFRVKTPRPPSRVLRRFGSRPRPVAFLAQERRAADCEVYAKLAHGDRSSRSTRLISSCQRYSGTVGVRRRSLFSRSRGAAECLSAGAIRYDNSSGTGADSGALSLGSLRDRRSGNAIRSASERDNQGTKGVATDGCGADCRRQCGRSRVVPEHPEPRGLHGPRAVEGSRYPGAGPGNPSGSDCPRREPGRHRRPCRLPRASRRSRVHGRARS